MASNRQLRVGDSGAMESSGRLTEKCGEVRWKRISKNSRLALPSTEVMVEEISFCQSVRVLMMNGLTGSTTQLTPSGEVFLVVRPNQRNGRTSRENAARRS